MLSQDQLVSKLFDTVRNNSTHQDYQRTVDHARQCFQWMTGDDQEEIIIRYKRREIVEQQEQRINLTNSRTQYVSNKVFNLYSEVHRSDRTVNNIRNQNDQLVGLENSLSKFHELKGLETYLDEHYRYFNFYDPNAFLVVEFKNDDPINAKPIVYPFEVRSANAVQYSYERGILQYLIARESITYVSITDGEIVTGNQWTMYTPGSSYVVQHIPDNAKFEIPDDYEVMQIMMAGVETTQRVIFKSFDTQSKSVPAMQFGYLRDPITEGRTFVSPIWPAEKILTDLIWRKSEYDLAHALHGFYQKFIYVDDCEECSGSGTVTYSDRSITCKSCEGSGTQHHMSTSDIIEIVRPDAREDHLPLSEMVHYEQIPMDLIRLQKEDLKDLERDTFNAIFGSNVLERTEVTVTATEKNYDWRAVNNTLLPYAQGYVNMYKFIVITSAHHRQDGDDITVEYGFPKDFNLESINDLLLQRTSAISSKAPYEIVQHIDLNIVQKQNKDNPVFVSSYRSIEQFRPFKDKSLDEIIFIVSMIPPTDSQRIAYFYWNVITQNIFIQFPDFHLFVFEKQRQIVDAEIASKAAMVAGTPVSLMPPDA